MLCFFYAMLCLALGPLGCTCMGWQGERDISQIELDGPLDGGGRRSCMELFVLYTQADKCNTLMMAPDLQSPDISVEICYEHGTGILLSIYTPMYAQYSTVFHAKLQGPQILVPHFTACSMVQRDDAGQDGRQNSNPIGVLRSYVPNLLPGNYSFMLHMVTENFTFGTHKEAPSNHESPLLHTTITLDDPGASAPKPMYLDTAAWPVCQRTFLHGTILSNLTTSQPLTKKLGRGEDTWQGLLRWQPQGCNLVPTDKINVQECLKDRLVCMIGDSHMRHILNGIVVSALGYTPPSTTVKAVYLHDNVRYINAPFLHLKDLETQDYAGCTDVLLTSQSWQLSKEVRARWTTGHFAQQLSTAFRWLRATLPGIPMYWVTAVSHKWLSLKSDCRYPPYMEAFNHVGVITARLHDMSVINAWDITEPLYETSHDNLHHNHTGVAGHFINEYVLNVLCVQR